MSVQTALALEPSPWFRVKDGDRRLREFYNRHYTSRDSNSPQGLGHRVREGAAMTGYSNPPTEADRLRAACRAVPCREESCKKPIIWLRNPATSKNVPVDAETVGADHDHYDRALGHVSHFTTCTAPNRFSKGGKR